MLVYTSNSTHQRIAWSFIVIVTTLFCVQSAYAGHNCAQIHIDSSASQSLGESRHLSIGSCEFRTSNGYPLPDPRCTPGAINPQVTVDILTDSAYGTKCIRNKTTSETKKKQVYSWYGLKRPIHNTGETQVCELDHLVPLELGGADTLDNLWPQCGPSEAKLRERYFKKKDLVENFLAAQVKQGRMTLKEAQEGIATDWTQFLDRAERCRGRKCR